MGREQIHVGAQKAMKPPTDEVERFLSLLRFDSKGKLDQLEVDLEISKIKNMK